MRKIFDVLIYDKLFDVYDIQGKEHEGYNDVCKTWWLYFSDKVPDGTTPPIDSEYWCPFSSSINRRVWEINIKEKNSTKEKWGGTNFRKHCHVVMKCNGVDVYEFTTLEYKYAMAKVQYLIVQMSESSFDYFNQEKENGRRIFFYGLPATIISKGMGEVWVKPDYETISKKDWWHEYRKRQPQHYDPQQNEDMYEVGEEETHDNERDDRINWGDAMTDHIWWHRK